MAKSYDVIIIGAGIVGLWCAVKARAIGLTVLVVDDQFRKYAASYGVIGALMPHQPTSWDTKKLLQFKGLSEFPHAISVLYDGALKDSGYKRNGRLMPMRNAEDRMRHENWAKGAQSLWSNTDLFPTPPEWLLDVAAPGAGFIDEEAAPAGLALDTLSAHVSPRGVMNILYKTACDLDAVFINGRATHLDADGSVQLADSSHLSAGHIICSAGWQSFSLLENQTKAQALGKGVKGQAALFRPDPSQKTILASAPLIFDQGLYIVPHADGTIAVGSTSENEFEDGYSTDSLLNHLIARARDLSPILRNVDPIETWAGIRAKAKSRDPVVGPLPDAPRILLASGGFKITFAIAHLMADAALAHVTSATSNDWPEALSAAALLAAYS